MTDAIAIQLYDKTELVVNPSSRVFTMRYRDPSPDGKWTRWTPIQIKVDIQDGLVHFPSLGPGRDAKTQMKYLEVVDILTEAELIEWRATGPEDRELFATDDLMKAWGKND